MENMLLLHKFQVRPVRDRMMVIKLLVFRLNIAEHDDEGLFQSIVIGSCAAFFCGFDYEMYICPKQAKRI
ncbi:hypothetical protein PAAL66ix_23330 [Paenibacillus alvei A6-6i-x]|nr:hypothetical protein PAAL66ix_23330 [Paenibacillus alvei A6-6i-x]